MVDYAYKQVIVVRKDIVMSKGKLAVQVAHASVSSVLEAVKRGGRVEEWVWAWYEEGQKKVIVKVKDLKELGRVFEEAVRRGLPCAFIRDAGKTELEPGTPTAVGIGPAPEELIDEITGELPLY